MSTNSFRTIAPAGMLAALCALAAPVHAQLPPPPPNATALQAAVFNAVAKMCVLDLDLPKNPPPANPQVNDLHDQCHAIAVANLNVMPADAGPIFGPAPAGALGALQQVSGNEVSTQGALATRVSAGQFGNITGRLNALRLGSAFSLSQGLSARTDSSAPGGSSLASLAPQTFYFDRSAVDPNAQEDQLSRGTLLPVGNYQNPGALVGTTYSDSYRYLADPAGGGGLGGNVPSPWGLFVQGSYNSGRHDQTQNEDPFDFHASSVTAGIDYNFGGAVLGASLGYDDYDAGFNNTGVNSTGGSAQVKGTSGSLYGAWFGQNWTLNGIATYGKLTTNLSRTVKYTVTYNTALDPQADINDPGCAGAATCTVSVNRTLDGNPDGRSLAVGATAGYQTQAASWDVMPSLSVNYRRASFDSFAEHDPNDPNDGLPLFFNDQTVESLRSILGLDLSKPVSTSFGVVTPILRVEWDHEFKTSVRMIDAHYVFDPSCKNGVCDSNFLLPTDPAVGNYGVAGVGLSVTLAQRVQAFVYDEILFGYQDYHSNAVTIGLRGQF
ncbi:MAG TPA: autotransporter outer membrane beta-barrel domain-containing protein [Steroidobacteraceae bacterium]|nr:autotransporter outer membrane beta-barrel domain-containing protein [Steroidobacteraceae bacterium]